MLRCTPLLALLASVSLTAYAQSSTTAPLATVTNQTTVYATSPVQTLREFPQNALRGSLVIGIGSQATLNGSDVRLAPGARIHNTDNLLVRPGQLTGQTLRVNYTLDSLKLVMDVWILNAQEAALLWPETAEQAATWIWDPVTHTWSKPS